MGPSAVPHKEGEAAPLALDDAGLARIRDAFVAAARRAERLGIDPVEFRRAKQFAVQGVGPTVVAALKRLAVAAPLGDRAGAVAADIAERPQLPRAVPYQDDRLAGGIG